MVRSEFYLVLKTDTQCLLCVRYTISLPCFTKAYSFRMQCVLCEASGVCVNLVGSILPEMVL